MSRLALRSGFGLPLVLCMVCAFVGPAMAADPVGAALQRQFIWRGGEQPGSAEFTVFRKAFVASEIDEARLHLFADARYVLWINGRYVERGPCRFDPAGPEYDSLDVARFLAPGSNALVVMVMSYPPGERATSGKMKRHAPGLTARLEVGTGAERSILGTDATWKWRTDLRYQPPDMRWGFVNNVVDTRRDDGDWTQSDYDDSGWGNAVPISGDDWGALRARLIPLLREQDVAVQGPKFPVELADSNAVHFALPRMVQGWFEVDAESTAGGSLKIEVGERGSLTNLSDTYGSAFTFTMGAGRHKCFSTDTMGFRYLKVSGMGGAVTLHGLRVVDRRYPYEDAGRFESSDPWLNDLWQRAVHTVRICSDDGYMDCGLREKAEWMGDAAVVAYPVSRVTLAGPARANEPLRSDARLMMSMVRHVAQSGGQYGDGRLKAHVPSDRLDIHAYIEDYSCLWVQSLREVFEHTGDTNLVIEVWPALTGQMEWFLDRRSSERGLVRAREFIIFDNPLKYVTCEGATLNAFVYRALLDAAALGEVIGETNQGASYRSDAARLQVSFNEHLWDATRGSYFGGLDQNGNVVTNDTKGRPLQETVTGHAAMLALDRGIVPPERLASVQRHFLASYDAAVGMPYTAYWALEQLYRLDDPARDLEALDYIRRKWRDVMTRTDTGTLTEGFNGGAACHNFGASCAYFLSSYILGVGLDGAARDRRLVIEPRLSGLTWARGSVVTELGIVPVAWERSARELRLTCTVPPGATAALRISWPANETEPGITLDGDGAVRSLRQGRYLVLSVGPGDHDAVLWVGH